MILGKKKECNMVLSCAYCSRFSKLKEFLPLIFFWYWIKKFSTENESENSNNNTVFSCYLFFLAESKLIKICQSKTK